MSPMWHLPWRREICVVSLASALIQLKQKCRMFCRLPKKTAHGRQRPAYNNEPHCEQRNEHTTNRRSETWSRRHACRPVAKQTSYLQQ
eukprot:9470716-Pyramimonas_sp.AAC.1